MCLLVNGTNRGNFTQPQRTHCRQSLAVSNFDILLFILNISPWHVNVGLICQVLLHKHSPDPGKTSLIFKLHVPLHSLYLLIIICWFFFPYLFSSETFGFRKFFPLHWFLMPWLDFLIHAVCNTEQPTNGTPSLSNLQVISSSWLAVFSGWWETFSVTLLHWCYFRVESITVKL